MKKSSEKEKTRARSNIKDAINVRLPVDIIENLEEALYCAKKELSRNKSKRLTKSKLYELILGEVADDFVTNGDESLLWKLVVVWSRN